MLDRKKFFDVVRRDLFGGRLTTEQVDGMNKIINYRDENWPVVSDDQLAYILATVKHETADEMQPVEEGFYLRDPKKIATFQRSLRYWPYFGRGLVQITWPQNYKRFNIKEPGDALKWPVALDVTFRGMIGGIFTGVKLSDFIKPGHVDYVHARKIINGLDKASLVASYATAFQKALAAARQ